MDDLLLVLPSLAIVVAVFWALGWRVRRPVFRIGRDCLQHWDRAGGYMCWGCCITGIDWFGSRWERARWFIAQPFRAAFFRLFARIEYAPDWSADRIPCCPAGGPPNDEGDEHLCDLTGTLSPVRYLTAVDSAVPA